MIERFRLSLIGQALLTMLLLGTVLTVSGCQTYVLEGRVVRGGMSDVLVVGSESDLLAGEGIGRVRVVVERDPNSPAQTRVADFLVAGDGSFSMPIKAFGTGWMNEVWKVQAYCEGYSTALVITRLPKEEQRLLITLAPGRALPLEEREDIMEQYRTYR